MRIFSIVVTYNGKEWIQKCLSSLMESIGAFSHQIIVIDNGSTDGTQQVIEKKFPEVILVQSDKNLGFGQANNIGLSKALKEGTDYAFLLNQDAWVEANTLEKLVKTAEGNPEYGIISPLHLNGRGDKLDQGFSNYIVPHRCPVLYSDAMLGKPFKDIYEAEYVNAAAWLLPRKTLEIVGGFDPIFFHYGEDDNYMQRVHFHKLKIGICPSVRIYHDREDRISNGNSKLMDNPQKSILVKYANVNFKGPDLISTKLKSLRRNFLLRWLLGKKSAHFFRNEIRILKKLKPIIEKSWQQNQLIGSNYLEKKQIEN